MSFLLSFLPRRWLREAMVYQWAATLTRQERLLLWHYGATNNENHHPWQWADDI